MVFELSHQVPEVRQFRAGRRIHGSDLHAPGCDVCDEVGQLHTRSQVAVHEERLGDHAARSFGAGRELGEL